MRQESLLNLAPSRLARDGAPSPPPEEPPKREPPASGNSPFRVEGASLEEAREFLRRNAEAGVACPCCGQFAKVYKRKLNSQMARFLVRLYAMDRRRKKKRWFHAREIVGGTDKASSDGTYLEHWRMIEAKPKEDGDTGRTSGMWGITESGRAFVEGRIDANRHVVLYNNELLDWSEETVTLQEALGDKFDYIELMKEAIGELERRT